MRPGRTAGTPLPTVRPTLSDAAASAGRRRFVWASVVATALSALPLVWIFWNLPQTAGAASGPIHENNYYEMQARAMFHGHLWVANGALGIEGFIHAGRQYTYFGLFPSLLRMPILLVTSSLDGKLTDPFITLAWLSDRRCSPPCWCGGSACWRVDPPAWAGWRPSRTAC